MGGKSLCVSQPTPTPAFLFPCIPSPSELHPTSKRDMRMKDGKSCCCCSCSDDIFRPSSSLFFSLFQRRTHSQVILRKRNDQEIESRGPRIVNRSEVVENHIRGLSLCGPFKCCSCLSLSLSLVSLFRVFLLQSVDHLRSERSHVSDVELYCTQISCASVVGLLFCQQCVSYNLAM